MGWWLAAAAAGNALLSADAADKNAEATRAQAKAQAIIMRENAKLIRESKSDVIDKLVFKIMLKVHSNGKHYFEIYTLMLCIVYD